MNETAIRLEAISKCYFTTPVFQHLSAAFPKGRIIGLLGENGVGKTTLLKLMAGLLKPDEGKVIIEEQAFASQGKACVSRVSWLLSPQDFYPFFKVSDALQYYKDFYQDFDGKKAEELFREWKLPFDRKISSLSKGEAERLCLFLALCRKVPIYLMDEPAAGFDIKLKQDMVGILLSQLEEDATVILATHLLRDFGDLFDVLAVLTKNGICIAESEEIREKGMSAEDYYLGVIQ